MKTIFHCPNCGGLTEADDNSKSVLCDYCGSNIISAIEIKKIQELSDSLEKCKKDYESGKYSVLNIGAYNIIRIDPKEPLGFFYSGVYSLYLLNTEEAAGKFIRAIERCTNPNTADYLITEIPKIIVKIKYEHDLNYTISNTNQYLKITSLSYLDDAFFSNRNIDYERGQIYRDLLGRVYLPKNSSGNIKQYHITMDLVNTIAEEYVNYKWEYDGLLSILESASDIIRKIMNCYPDHDKDIDGRRSSFLHSSTYSNNTNLTLKKSSDFNSESNEWEALKSMELFYDYLLNMMGNYVSMIGIDDVHGFNKIWSSDSKRPYIKFFNKAMELAWRTDHSYKDDKILKRIEKNLDAFVRIYLFVDPGRGMKPF